MAASPPPVGPLSALKPGDCGVFFARLVEKTRKQHANRPFYQCRFQAGPAAWSSVIWPDSPHFADCESVWHLGHCYKIHADLVDYEKYGPQLAIHRIREVKDEDREAGFDPASMVNRSRFEPTELLDELRLLVEALTHEPFRRLTLLVLDQNRDRLLIAPGSETRYHPFAGGWLEHTLSVANSCRWLADKYQAHYPDLTLNVDLLIAGAVLHDIGRIVELGGMFGNEPTVPGRLIGHVALGRDLVRDAAREVPELDPADLLLLEHLILSHLALPEWGSPRLPAIPEALILHHADDLDAKLEMYARCLARDTSTGPFTDRDPVLGKPLLKR